jgi:hypothetical protein
MEIEKLIEKVEYWEKTYNTYLQYKDGTIPVPEVQGWSKDDIIELQYDRLLSLKTEIVEGSYGYVRVDAMPSDLDSKIQKIKEFV